MMGSTSGLVASYSALFLLVGLESLGIPLPGETALVTAAAAAATGRLSIAAVIATAAAAAILGDNGGYWIGRQGGLPLVRRFGRNLHLNETHLERARGFFERHGGKAVFMGRFVALLRTWVAVLAGTARMPYYRFMAYNAVGGVCWAVLFGALGYLLGYNLPRLEHYIGRASLVGVLLVALVVGLALGWRWFERNLARLASRAGSLWQRAGGTPALQHWRTRHPRAWTFVSARFARGEFLGLHLTVGFLVSLAALWLFGGITEDVIHHDPLTQLDASLLHWLRQHATPGGDAVFRVVSLLGSGAMMAVLGLATALLLTIQRRWIPLGGLLAALIGGGLLDLILKSVIRRPRPPGAEAFLSQWSWSFPSGHSLGSLIGYGLVAYLLVTLWVRRRALQIGVVAGAALLILAIGFSRLYLGVHYFSDVVGGYAAGLVWLSACISGIEVARRMRDS